MLNNTVTPLSPCNICYVWDLTRVRCVLSRVDSRVKIVDGLE